MNKAHQLFDDYFFQKLRENPIRIDSDKYFLNHKQIHHFKLTMTNGDIHKITRNSKNWSDEGYLYWCCRGYNNPKAWIDLFLEYGILIHNTYYEPHKIDLIEYLLTENYIISMKQISLDHSISGSRQSDWVKIGRKNCEMREQDD